MEKREMMKTKNQVQTEQQFLYNLAQVIEAFPQYTIAQHLCHLLRKKNELKSVYFWSDEITLNKMESYYDELKEDLLVNTEEDI